MGTGVQCSTFLPGPAQATVGTANLAQANLVKTLHQTGRCLHIRSSDLKTGKRKTPICGGVASVGVADVDGRNDRPDFLSDGSRFAFIPLLLVQRSFQATEAAAPSQR